MTSRFESVSGQVDVQLRALEDSIARGESLDLQATVAETLALAVAMMRAQRADRVGDPGAADHFARLVESDDPLEVFRAFVKGEPSLNAIRDNVRELVFYRNCLTEGRADALPPQAAVMAVRTIRHIHLYLRSRLAHGGRRPGP